MSSLGRGSVMESGTRLHPMCVSFHHSFFDTAKLVRQTGGEPSQIRFVVSLRLWF